MSFRGVQPVRRALFNLSKPNCFISLRFFSEEPPRNPPPRRYLWRGAHLHRTPLAAGPGFLTSGRKSQKTP